MKSIAFVIAVLMAGVCQAQIKMSVSVNGMSVGTAVLNQKLNAAGGIEQSLHMTLEIQATKAEFTFISVTDKSGRMVREVNGQSAGPTTKTTTMVFGSTSIKVTTVENGKTKTSTVPISKGNLADVSTFWFVNTRPKVGATSNHLSFSAEKGKWKTANVKYVGDDTVPGTKLKAHHVHQDDGDVWLDNKGLPIRIEMNQDGGQLIFMRQ